MTSNTGLNTDTTIQKLTNRNPPMKELATSKTITIVTNMANFTFRDQTGNMSANAVPANRKIYCASSPLLLKYLISHVVGNGIVEVSTLATPTARQQVVDCST